MLAIDYKKFISELLNSCGNPLEVSLFATLPAFIFREELK